MKNQTQDQPIRKDSNKIYFLIAVIVALLGTNAFLFFKDKKANERIVTISDEKTRMQTEIDKIEAELDNVSSQNIQLSEQMKTEHELAKRKIAELRAALLAGQITQGELAKAQRDVKQLRYFVSKYTADIQELRKKNASLISERENLLTKVDSVNTRASELEKVNQELNNKVKTASSLHAGDVSIKAYEVRRNGKENAVSRAKNAEKLRVDFTLVNPLAEERMYNLFLRVIDPSGNLIVFGNAGMFVSDNQDLQYTYKTAFEFQKSKKSYSVDWVNNSEFEKGVYTVLLYTDGYILGKGTVSLR